MKLPVLVWLGMVLAWAAGPPCQIGMVVRAGALNYDAKILSFNPANGLYKVQFITGFKGDIEYVGPKGLKTCEAPEMAPVPVPWFVGVWQLTTGGGGAWAKNPTSGSWKVVGLDAAGAPPIRINADGSYEWVIDAKVTVNGRWREAAASERKYGYDKLGTVVFLERGEDGKNWLVSRLVTGSSDERDRILIERTDLGLTYPGARVGKISAVAGVPVATAPAGNVLAKGNAMLPVDAAKWTSMDTRTGFRLESKDQKASTVLQLDPAQTTARGYAEGMLAQMRRGDPNLRIVEQAQRAVNGTDRVVMRVDMTRSGQALSYYLVFVADAGGGAALVSWATADNFPRYLTDFTTLADGLQLKR